MQGMNTVSLDADNQGYLSSKKIQHQSAGDDRGNGLIGFFVNTRVAEHNDTNPYNPQYDHITRGLCCRNFSAIMQRLGYRQETVGTEVCET